MSSDSSSIFNSMSSGSSLENDDDVDDMHFGSSLELRGIDGMF